MGQATNKDCCCSKSEHPDVEEVSAQSARPEPSVPWKEGTALESPELPTVAPSRTGTGDLNATPIVDLRRTDTSGDLLRGVALCKTLLWGGVLWRYKPEALQANKRAGLFEASKKVDELDLFFSHCWETPGRWKVIALMMHYGWPCMLIGALLGAVIGFTLSILNVLPPLVSLTFSISGVEAQVPVGNWTVLASFLFTMGGLMVFPYVCKNKAMCFLDCACIHQTDPRLMQRGIQNIGGFLQASSELHVLWSEPYLSRLWCVFELAAYRKLRPNGKIRVTSIGRNAVLLLSCPINFLGVWMGLLPIGNYGPLVIIAFGLAFPFAMAVRRHSLQKLSHKQQLLSGLRSFDVQSASCASDFDKSCIFDAIQRWYGSLDTFSEYVRGPFRTELQEGVCAPGTMPLGYVCVTMIPFTCLGLDLFAALAKSGAPTPNVLSFFLAFNVGAFVLWFPASSAAIQYYFDRWSLGSGTWGFSRVVETISLFGGAWLLLAAGILIPVQALSAGPAFATAWTLLALLYACLVFWALRPKT